MQAPVRLAVMGAGPVFLNLIHDEDLLRYLCSVIRGTAEPVVSGREGLNTLKVIAAAKEAAATGKVVEIV